MDWGHYLFSFNGRSNRAKQWLFIVLFLVPAFIYEEFVTKFLGVSWRQIGHAFSGDGLASPVGRNVMLLMTPFWLITAIPTLAVGIKRLHDRNKSGWWIILLVYAPWTFGVFQFTLLPGTNSGTSPFATLAKVLIAVVVFGLELWGFVELYCLRGSVGQNRFGADPLGAPVEGD